MTKVRIYQPAKNAMQSGRANAKLWLLEHEPMAAKQPDPLMGWIGSGDTLSQVRLRFSSLDEAVAYAKDNNLEYTVTEPKQRRIRPKNYSENFAYDRIR